MLACIDKDLLVHAPELNTDISTGKMQNTWSYDDSTALVNMRQPSDRSAHAERDRRTRATQIVSMFKSRLEAKFPSMVAKEMLSVLMRQRGIPDMDPFTQDLVGRYRAGLGMSPVVEGTVRKIMAPCKWENANTRVTLWMLEPVVSSLEVQGNRVNVAAAKENFSKHLIVIEPLTMTTHTTSVSDNRIKGRWAGWLVSKEMERTGEVNAACTTCNMSGTTIFFAIHSGDEKVMQAVMTPESVKLISSYARSVCSRMGTTSTMVVYTSTKLKIQPGVRSGRSSSLSLFGNGSVQMCGSPIFITPMVATMLEIVKLVMEMDMYGFMRTLRVVDVDVI